MIVLEWTLIVGIVLSLALCTVALIRSFKEGFTRRWSAVFVLGLGFLFIIYLTYNLDKIEPAAQVQIMLMIGLLAVTGIYALRTSDIADATRKQAEEMREQRYDALRPIIDIVEEPVEPKEMATRAYNAKEGIFPKKLVCRLRNIGVGPAIEVYSFIEDARGETCRWDFGSIPVAIGEEEMGYTRRMPLSLQQRGEHKALVAYYKDVFDNPFESSLEVRLDREKSALKIVPLKIRPLPKEENINDS